MNAAEQSLRPSRDRLAGASPPGDAPEVELGQPVEAGALSAPARLLRRLLQAFGDPPIEFQLWNGERIATSRAETVARVRLEDRGVILGLLRDAQVRFGDAYAAGRLQIEGDLVRLVEEIYRGSARASARKSLLRSLSGLLHRPHTNSLTGSRDNIHHHYDIGNEFYSLWLGQTMAYTCAYYPTAAATLDEAQTRRWITCAASCGCVLARASWRQASAGARLALHMARHYGVKVRAFNISHEQVAYARERARAEGLASHIEYVEDDYRNISGRYDAFVSVGMLEHVGVENYPELGRVAQRSLGPNGRGLIHSIGRNYPAPLHPWIERRIFPGAYPPSLSEMAQIFEPCDLSVLDVENLRLHYARTLRALARAVRAAMRSACVRCSMRSSCVCGGCTWRARSRLSRPGPCSCSRWCSRRGTTTTFR